MQVILAVIAILATASAFAPIKSNARFSRNMNMNMENPMKKFIVPSALAPFFAPLASIAAEGTGRAFGYDDGRLIVASLLPLTIILPLYLNWASQQDGDDFFDGYEKRRNG